MSKIYLNFKYEIQITNYVKNLCFIVFVDYVDCAI